MIRSNNNQINSFNQKTVDVDIVHILSKTDIIFEPYSYINGLKDTGVGGRDSYLDMLYPRLQLMKRLLNRSALYKTHSIFYR